MIRNSMNMNLKILALKTAAGDALYKPYSRLANICFLKVFMEEIRSYSRALNY